MERYRFFELDENAKKNAVSMVKPIEDLSLDWRKIHAIINDEIRRKLSFDGISIYQAEWEYGSSIADKLVLLSDIHPSFFGKIPKELQELRNDLIFCSNGQYNESWFFQEDRNLYEFSFHFGAVSDKEVYHLLSKYSPKIYELFRLRLLTGTELSGDERVRRYNEFFSIGKELSKELTANIIPYFKEIYKTVHKFIINKMSYYCSEQYYYDRLNDPTEYLSHYYYFNPYGKMLDYYREII